MNTDTTLTTEDDERVDPRTGEVLLAPENAWGEFTPFLSFPPEIRRLIYTTNGIESLNARFRQATRRRGHFPNEQSAMKVLYLTVLERRPNGRTLLGRSPAAKLS